jgi:Na+/H+-dicarboxylate symporter
MIYTASQIIIWIVIALALGVLVGWIARGRRTSKVKRRRRF